MAAFARFARYLDVAPGGKGLEANVAALPPAPFLPNIILTCLKAMLRRLLCSSSAAALPADLLSIAALGGVQRAIFSSTAGFCGLHGHAAQPCTSLMPLLDAAPHGMPVPGDAGGARLPQAVR